MNGALTRYRLCAYVVGVGLIILVFVGMPLKYLAGRPIVVEIVGPAHGFLYMVYLAFAFELAVRQRWSLVRTALVMLAGTVPAMSFVAERNVTRWARERSTAPAAEVATAGTPRPR